MLVAFATIRGAASLNFATTPSGNNVLVVRSTGSTTANLDEYLPTTTTQAAAQQSLAVTGCNIATSLDQVYASATGNHYYAVFPCGLSSTTSRVIARVSSTGVVDVTTAYSSSTATYLPRGAASLDGVQIYSSDGHGISTGTLGSTFPAAITTADYYYGSAVGVFSGACGQ